MNNNQLEAQRHLHDWRVGALFMEAGTGKTHVAVNIVNETRRIRIKFTRLLLYNIL